MIKCETIQFDLEMMKLDIPETARVIKRYGDYMKFCRSQLERFAENDEIDIDIKAASDEELAWALATNY